jgi:ribosomal protein S18 acetylase RimI-like enzyme
MSNILQDIADPALPAAIEANFAQEMICFGQGLPGGVVNEDQDLLWFFTGRPHLNAVMFTHFSTEDKEYIHRKIDTIIAYYKERETDFGWSVGPTTKPGDFSTYLEDHGFYYCIDTIGMAVNIQAINEDIPTATSLVIREAANIQDLQPLYDLEMKGFGASEEIAKTYFEVYAHIGFGGRKNWHHFIGYQDGKAVAMSSLLLHAGVAGIYGVATIPEVRRKGIGAAMTLNSLHAAQSLGYQIAIISPTEMSEDLYLRIGFQECSRISHYGWSAER